jgi:hypothetical protein
MDRLPLDLQRRVLDFADALTQTVSMKGAPGAALKPMLGRIDEESARQMLAAIEDGCERVDEGGW